MGGINSDYRCVFRVLFKSIISAQSRRRIIDFDAVKDEALSRCGSLRVSEDKTLYEWFDDMVERGYLEKIPNSKYLIVREIYIIR